MILKTLKEIYGKENPLGEFVLIITIAVIGAIIFIALNDFWLNYGREYDLVALLGIILCSFLGYMRVIG